MSRIVVKSNRLIQALQSLSLVEVRLLQIAIAEARETGLGLSAEKPLELNALKYAKEFNVSPQAAYAALIEAEDTLFKRQFTISNDDGTTTKSRWVQDVNYQKGGGRILLTLSRVVVDNITRLDGFEQYFTSYHIKNTSRFKSVYTVRLYELLITWRSMGKTPVFKLGDFRNQIGLGVNEYKAMSDFKKRILDVGVEQINKHADIIVDYEQHKNGRIIIGFSFSIKIKKTKEGEVVKRDPKTVDWLNGVADGEIKGMTQSQAILFADQLHMNHAIVGNWGDCKSYNETKEKLIHLLQQPTYVKKYMSYLLACEPPFDPKTVGFK